MRDFNGNEVARVYADQWGVYNGLYFSTYGVNPPNPTGYVPQMAIACMNDPGPIADPVTGAMITDPAYNPAYSNFCYEMPFMPGFTAYMDTPVIPTQAFADDYNLPDSEYPDATPAIASVVNSNATRQPQGPWVTSGAGTPGTVKFTLSNVTAGNIFGTVGGDTISSITVGSTTIYQRHHHLQHVDCLHRHERNFAEPCATPRWPAPWRRASTHRTGATGLFGHGQSGYRDGDRHRARRCGERHAAAGRQSIRGHGFTRGARNAPGICRRDGQRRRRMRLTITALGDKVVQNPNFSGPNSTTAPYNQKTITRHYGFGATAPEHLSGIGRVPERDGRRRAVDQCQPGATRRSPATSTPRACAACAPSAARTRRRRSAANW